MKIIAVRIKNLASLEGFTEIDFTAEPLCSAGIFAITGATGAGKSTILDAICLALYSKTPRYLQAKESGIEIQDVQGSSMSQGDVRSILRDGTADGFAEVDFVGVDKEYYRANWSVRRARNKIEGSMQSDTLLLKNITSNLEIPGRKNELLKEIERLVGLNFEQFTRSVLLAQGDFTAFMKANKDEKSSLLEKLTGTHIYSEISKKIYERFKGEEYNLRDLNSKKEGILALSSEEIAIIKNQQIELRETLQQHEVAIEKLTAEVLWHNQNTEYARNVELSSKNLESALQIQESAKSRRTQLQLVDHSQVTKSWFDRYTLDRQNKIEREKNVADIQNNIVKYNIVKSELAAQSQALELDSLSKAQHLAAAIPQLEKAKMLDILIAEVIKQVRVANTDFEKAAQNKRDLTSVLNAENSSLKILTDDRDKVAGWLRENKDKQRIADDSQIIISKLTDAAKNLRLKIDVEQRIQVINGYIKLVEKTLENLQISCKAYAKEYSILERNLADDRKVELLFPIEKIELTRNELELQLQKTVDARASWIEFSNAITDYSFVKTKLESTSNALKQNQLELQSVSDKLKIQTAEKEASAKMLHHARVSATQSVEELRKILVGNEPCPVCGSTNHPYAQHNPSLDIVLHSLENSYKEVESRYIDTLRQHSSLEQLCISAQIIIDDLSAESIIKKKQTDLKQNIWQLQMPGGMNTNQAGAEVKWFDEKLVELREQQAQIKKDIQEHSEHVKKVEAVKSALEKVKEKRASNSMEIKTAENSLAILKEKLTDRVIEENRLTSEIEVLKAWANPYFTAENWMRNWDSDPDGFTTKIELFASEYKSKHKALDEFLKESELLAGKISELNKQFKLVETDFKQKLEVKETKSAEFHKLKSARALLFNGRDVTTVHSELVYEVDTVQQNIKENTEKRNQIDINLIKSETERAQLELEIHRLTTDIQKNLSSMQHWLKSYNRDNKQSITLDGLSELLRISQDDIRKEKIALQSIDNHVLTASSALTEHKNSSAQHQLKKISSREFDEIKESLHILKTIFNEQKQLENQTTFKLEQDSINKERIGDLLLEIDTQAKITENWSKLNEIIGSSDGKKFRQIAQEYTLDALLSFANVHLESLTSRYQIERIPATLALQIIDQDMGDEVRTVYSLSGGESFLVSLALALGLASLSSNKMKVESLFIDEGFGSLDPNTLNIAMDALERLHNQGRKVGVISHVQEMTERIPVQIKVSKMASGKSKVEILG